MYNKPSSDAIRLLEASVDSLSLGLFGLSIPRRHNYNIKSAKFAPEVGLLGIAAELGMTACLVECYGTKHLMISDHLYKSGGQILDDFRNLFKKETHRASEILTGLEQVDKFIDQLIDVVRRFRILINLRAAAVHAGQGQNYEVSLVAAQNVADFLRTLALSEHFEPYLQNIPVPPNLIQPKSILVEDLINQIYDATTLEEKAVLLCSVFLVLPDIPDDSPDWLEAFDKVSVSPKENDVAFLLDVVEKAHPISLTRQSSTGPVTPVRPAPQNSSSALKFSFTDIRREFTHLRDQWFADTGNANVRIKQGILDLPPDDFTVQLFIDGLESAQITEAGGKVGAQQTWPYVISSISVSGIVRPYWYLIKATDNLDQLLAFLQQALPYINAYARKNLPDVMTGITCMKQNETLSSDCELHQTIQKFYNRMAIRRSQIAETIVRNRSNHRNAPEELEHRLMEVHYGNEEAGTVLAEIVTNKFNLTVEQRRYWANYLAEGCTKLEDRPGMFMFTKSDDFRNTYSYAWKSLQVLDFLNFGPLNYL